MPFVMRVWGGAIIPIVFYSMIALVAGQVTGEAYTWSQLWPSGLALGTLFGSTFALFGLYAAIESRNAMPLLMALIGQIGAAVFFGLFFAIVWWIFPRMIKLNLLIFDFSPQAWGVQL